MLAAFRLLIVLIGYTGKKWAITESLGDLFFLVTGDFVLLLMGIFPSIFIGSIWKIFAPLLTIT
jgi:hypothetical protein